MEQCRLAAQAAEAAREEMSHQLLKAYDEVAQLQLQLEGLSGMEAELQSQQDRLDLAMEILGERNARVRYPAVAMSITCVCAFGAKRRSSAISSALSFYSSVTTCANNCSTRLQPCTATVYVHEPAGCQHERLNMLISMLESRLCITGYINCLKKSP